MEFNLFIKYMHIMALKLWFDFDFTRKFELNIKYFRKNIF